MFKTVIIANLSTEQLAYVKNLATENGIIAEYVVESEEVEQPAPSATSLTGAMLDEVATLTGKSVIEIATLASQYGITTVEEALSHEDVPSEIKELLESYL